MYSVEKGYVFEIEFQSIDRGEQPARDLAKLRVNIDRSYRDGEHEDGSARYNHDKDFWINVEMWGSGTKSLRGIVNKGARVVLVGRYEARAWKDKESGEDRSRMVFVAAQVALDPSSIDSIAYKKKAGSAGGAKAAGEAEDDDPLPM